jgi:hypothetical protein
MWDKPDLHHHRLVADDKKAWLKTEKTGFASMVAASRFEAKVLAKKRHYVVLKTIGDRTCMGSLVDLEAVLQTVLIEYFVELGGVNVETVLVANVHGDALVSP